MGRRRRGKGKKGEDAEGEEEAPQQRDQPAQHEVPPSAVVATHPDGSVVVAYKQDIRVYTRGAGVQLESTHTAPVRSLAFEAGGRYFVSAGDDKQAKVWDTATWTTVDTWSSPKKISSVAFTPDGKWVLFANKYGEVLVVPSPSNTEATHLGAQGEAAGAGGSACDAEEQDDKATGPGGKMGHLLLAHCCSIITDLKVDPEGRHVITSDRDDKVRVTVLPSDPLRGAHEVQAYCLGHLSFITALTVVQIQGHVVLVSASGDSTLRLWEPTTGVLLDTFQVAPEPASVIALAGRGGEGKGCVAAAVEGTCDVLLLDVEVEGAGPAGLQARLVARQHLRVASPACAITSMEFAASGQLWMVGIAAAEGRGRYCRGEGVGGRIPRAVCCMPRGHWRIRDDQDTAKWLCGVA